MQKSSPEDRLLNLIKGKDAKKNETKQIPGFKKRYFLAELIKRFVIENKLFHVSYLKIFNMALFGLFIILSGFFAYIFLSNEPEYTKFTAQEERESPVVYGGPQREPPPIQAADYAFYKGMAEGKELFSTPLGREPEIGKTSEVDITARFNLVGIISGDKPQAIIEDKETQKTYYLYCGQSFSGITVEKIGEGRVVLNFRGSQITIVL